MNENLIKEYVKVVLQEGAFRRGVKKYSHNSLFNSGGSILGKMVNFFAGSSLVDKIAKEWIEEHEINYDISSEKAKEIISFAKDIYPKILKLSQVDGDKSRAETITRRQLDKRFADQITK